MWTKRPFAHCPKCSGSVEIIETKAVGDIFIVRFTCGSGSCYKRYVKGELDAMPEWVVEFEIYDYSLKTQ